MLISVIGGLVTAFAVYQGCHSVDTIIQGRKAAKDVADNFADNFADDDDFIDDITDDVIVEEPVSDSGEQPPTQQPRNEKGQFTKK